MIQVNPQMCPSVIRSVAGQVCLYVSHMTCLSVNQNVIPPGSLSIHQYVDHQFCPSNHQLNSQ